jgi:hypothetical protein
MCQEGYALTIFHDIEQASASPYRAKMFHSR